MIYRIIIVEVRVISRAEGDGGNSYRDFDNYTFQTEKINMACKTKNKHRWLNMQITELFACK